MRPFRIYNIVLYKRQFCIIITEKFIKDGCTGNKLSNSYLQVISENSIYLN
jgi:hypothetical protein